MTTPPATPPRCRLITAGLALGTLLTLSPLLGVLGTIVGMMNSFAALGSDGAAGGTQALSRGIGQSLVATAVGLALFLPGVTLLIISIIHHRRATRAALPPQVPPP